MRIDNELGQKTYDAVQRTSRLIAPFSLGAKLLLADGEAEAVQWRAGGTVLLGYWDCDVHELEIDWENGPLPEWNTSLEVDCFKYHMAMLFAFGCFFKDYAASGGKRDRFNDLNWTEAREEYLRLTGASE